MQIILNAKSNILCTTHHRNHRRICRKTSIPPLKKSINTLVCFFSLLAAIPMSIQTAIKPVWDKRKKIENC